MSLHLTPADQHRLGEATRILLCPLDHADVDDWRRSVNCELKALFGAEMASFLLPVPSRAVLFSEEVDSRTAQAYPGIEPEIPGGKSMWERQLELGAWNRQLVFGKLLGAYYRSGYWHDLVRPARGYDSLGITISLDRGTTPRELAGLMWHHTSPRGARFGSRGLTLARLLKPVFAAGLRSYWCYQGQRECFARMIDQMGTGALLIGLDGSMLHQTPAITRLLEAEPERALFLVHARRVASVVQQLCTGGSWDAVSREHGRFEMLRTRSCTYRFHASLVPSELTGTGPLAVVTAERLTDNTPSLAELGLRYRLTPSEGRVALLLAARKSNREIARTLFVSEHTARRHTERVLQKLAVHSRHEVAAVVSSAFPSPD